LCGESVDEATGWLLVGVTVANGGSLLTPNNWPRVRSLRLSSTLYGVLSIRIVRRSHSSLNEIRSNPQWQLNLHQAKAPPAEPVGASLHFLSNNNTHTEYSIMYGACVCGTD
jgi:hypothetical protein